MCCFLHKNMPLIRQIPNVKFVTRNVKFTAFLLRCIVYIPCKLYYAGFTCVNYMAILKFLQRNLVSISFPTLTATLIWLDYNHTRKWKALQKQN